MKRLRDQSGQAFVLTCIFIVALLGIAALVLDVGSWYRAQRDVQAAADAAVLAGAHALPLNTGRATALAHEYVQKNDAYTVEDIRFSAQLSADDTISVRLSTEAPGFFAKVLGIDSVIVRARASARAQGVDAARWVAPIAVNEQHPKLAGPACQPYPCSGITRIDLIDLHRRGSGDASGAFGLLDLAGGNGSVGDSELADWMSRGFDKFMKKGTYHSVPSAKFNGSNFCEAVEDHIGDIVYFPVYQDPPGVLGSGSNARYIIIGWVGFRIKDVDCRGSRGWVEGEFEGQIIEGIQAESGGEPSFGARAIELVE
jgi:hypothetical protein